MCLSQLNFPGNIHLDEDVLKTSSRHLSSSSSEHVFKTSSRHLDQDEYIRLTHTSSEDVFKTSSRRCDQDEYIRLTQTSSEDVFIKTNIIVLVIRLQDVFKKYCKSVFKTPSSCLQDVFKTSSRRVPKTSCKNVFKTSSRHLQDLFKTF